MKPVIGQLLVAALVVLAVSGCSRPPLEALNGAAMYPSMRRNARCRVDRSLDAPRAGQVFLVTIDGHAVVRRVIGVPGDRVAVRGGRVILNGTVIPQTILSAKVRCVSGVSARCMCQISSEAYGERSVKIQRLHPTKAGEDFRCAVRRDSPQVTVPKGEVYVLGDNRDGAIDSSIVGPISTIVGRVISCR